MATPEGRVKTKLKRMLDVEGVYHFAPNAGPYGKSGIPDRIAIVRGLFVGIEAKADGKKEPSELQKLARDAIRAAGGVWFLVYDDATIESVKDFIRNASNTGTESTSTQSRGQRPRAERNT